jgi:hypothetical protein
LERWLVSVWIYAFRPFLKIYLGRLLRKYGWKGRYEMHLKGRRAANIFRDLDHV